VDLLKLKLEHYHQVREGKLAMGLVSERQQKLEERLRVVNGIDVGLCGQVGHYNQFDNYDSDDIQMVNGR
jgi:hypothetical protein